VKRLLSDVSQRRNQGSGFVAQANESQTRAEQIGRDQNNNRTPPPAAAARNSDLSTLAALAGPAAGLAAAAMQRQQSSGLSDPGASMQQPQIPAIPSQGPAPAQLGGQQGNQSSAGATTGTGPAESATDDHHTPATDFAYSPGGFEPHSGISNTNFRPNGGGAPLGVTTGSNSFGGGGGSASRTDDAEAVKAQPPPQLPEEPPFAFGSGGGGGYGFPPPPPSHSDDGGTMGDILHDMESTLDSGEFKGVFSEFDDAQQGDGVGSPESGILFQRVSACVVRALKRGNLLNGLGEKVFDSENID
jgi:hypothetical protein